MTAAAAIAGPVSAQKLAGYGVAAIAAVLVLYPVFFLLQAALDVGDPQVRPPTAYGFDNFGGLLQYPQILLQHADGLARRDRRWRWCSASSWRGS